MLRVPEVMDVRIDSVSSMLVRHRADQPEELQYNKVDVKVCFVSHLLLLFPLLFASHFPRSD